MYREERKRMSKIYREFINKLDRPKEELKNLDDYKLLIEFHKKMPHVFEGRVITKREIDRVLRKIKASYSHDTAEEDILNKLGKTSIDREKLNRYRISTQTVRILAKLGRPPTENELEDILKRDGIKSKNMFYKFKQIFSKKR